MPYNKKAIRSSLVQKGDTELPNLSGNETRMVVADLNGNLSAQPLPQTGTPGSVAAGDALKETITQADHGFTVGTVVRNNGTAWVRSLAVQAANTDYSAEVAGIITSLSSLNSFVLTTIGLADVFGLNLQPQRAYFLSATVPGTITQVAPTQPGQVVKPVLLTRTAGTAFVLQMTGEVLGASVAPGTGTGVTDGDKGDITVSDSGATWVIEQDAVTFVKLQNIGPGMLLGRVPGTAGDVQQIIVGANLSFDAATNTLNGPAPGNGTGTGVTDGDKTDIVVSATGTVWLVKAARILNQALIGLAPIAGEATAADTILQAISKILNFIQGIAATVRNTVLTGVDVNLPGTVVATDSVLQAAGKLQRQLNETGVASGIQTGTNIDFAVNFQSRTVVSNETLNITSFSNMTLGRTVRFEITLSNGSAVTMNVTGMVRLDTGFPFVPNVVNLLEIRILPNNRYETFNFPLT